MLGTHPIWMNNGCAMIVTTKQVPRRPARRKLTLTQLWKLGRKMGLKSRPESTQIIRKMRDEAGL